MGGAAEILFVYLLALFIQNTVNINHRAPMVRKEGEDMFSERMTHTVLLKYKNFGLDLYLILPFCYVFVLGFTM